SNDLVACWINIGTIRNGVRLGSAIPDWIDCTTSPKAAEGWVERLWVRAVAASSCSIAPTRQSPRLENRSAQQDCARCHTILTSKGRKCWLISSPSNEPAPKSKCARGHDRQFY